MGKGVWALVQCRGRDCGEVQTLRMLGWACELRCRSCGAAVELLQTTDDAGNRSVYLTAQERALAKEKRKG